ncbi:uncharacterized protein LOC134192193 [Corticium candelabrum]|uniref:uncharacterized protein LOC134192193 n=1 Tax=Corticium candelabrum TaxID=121492 RepID=UPI002E2541CF|nr:uncharacterized protein LOC134192193 [Corticium candelabrum]
MEVVVGRVAAEVRYAARIGVNMFMELLHLTPEVIAPRALARARVLLEFSRDDIFDAALSAEDFMHALGQFDAWPVMVGEADEAAFTARLNRDVEYAEDYISSFQEKAQRARERTSEANEFVETNVLPARNRIRLFEAIREFVGEAASLDENFIDNLATTSNRLSRDAASLFAYAREWRRQLVRLKISLSRGHRNLVSVREELETLRDEVNAAATEVINIQRDLRQYLHPERNDI